MLSGTAQCVHASGTPTRTGVRQASQPRRRAHRADGFCYLTPQVCEHHLCRLTPDRPPRAAPAARGCVTRRCCGRGARARAPRSASAVSQSRFHLWHRLHLLEPGRFHATSRARARKKTRWHTRTPYGGGERACWRGGSACERPEGAGANVGCAAGGLACAGAEAHNVRTPDRMGARTTRLLPWAAHARDELAQDCVMLQPAAKSCEVERGPWARFS